MTDTLNGAVAMPACNGRFPTTHWSVVLRAGTDSNPGAESLKRLCESYWYPVYAFIRRRGIGTDDAQDLTQEFFCRVLAEHVFSEADPIKGRFRTFLLTVLTRFLSHERERNHAAKRGGNCITFSLDAQAAEDRYRHEPCDQMTPERIFERRWALTLLEQALDQLRKEYARAGKTELFNRLQPFLSDSEYGAASQMAAETGLTESTARVWIYRVRRRFGELLRESIAETLSDPAELDAEVRHIIAALSG